MSKEFMNDPSIIKDFVVEFQEHLQHLEPDVLRLEKEPENREVLDGIFRPMHSLKGVAAFLGFTSIKEFAHKIEDILVEIRKEQRKVTPAIIDLLLSALDVMDKMINDVSSGGDGSSVDVSVVMGKVAQLQGETAAAAAAPAPAPSPAPVPEAAVAPAPAPEAAAAPAPVETPHETIPVPEAASDKKIPSSCEVFLQAAQQYINVIKKEIDEIQEKKGQVEAASLDGFERSLRSLKSSCVFMGFRNTIARLESFEPLLDKLKVEKENVPAETIAAFPEAFKQLQEIIEFIRQNGRDEAAPAEAPKAEGAAPAEAAAAVKKNGNGNGNGGAKQADLSEQTVRVPMHKLDLLMNLIGELIINRSRFGNLEKKVATEFNMPELSRELREANLSTDRVIDDLHTAIMDTRMVAIGTVFNRFPRMVRDLARDKKKSIELVISGEETEIDKTITEQIYDPLLHLIRNSADHGVETPEVRTAAGKPATGTIYLRAYHEGGTVVIEVEDDGKGINPEVVRAKAIKNKVLPEEQLRAMSDAEVYNLIFLPGFSTAEVVTDVSGRGVGMDVVKTNIEKLRGKIHIQTEVGKGTKMTLKLPLTMAIIDALMVRVGEELFALPLLAISGISRINSTEIQHLQGEEAVTLHGRTVGVVRLGNLLNVGHNDAGGKVYVITIEAKNEGASSSEIGFIVDSVKEKEKVVVKSLDDSVTDTAGVSGVTILGDGRVALILDPVELVNMSMQQTGGVR